MDSLTHLTIDELATRCREESNQLEWESASESGSCWELFRRAIVENDQQAWQALYDQYRRLVGKWAKGSDLKLDDLVNETFARFWKGVRDHDFVSRFPTTKAVIGFLKRCARTMAIDTYRRNKHQQLVREAMAAESSVAADLPNDVTLEQVYAQELRAYLHNQMRDEDERAVFEAYCQGLMPREIVEQYPDRFASVRQVYRVRERIVSRLAEDPMVQKWWAS